MFSSRSSIVLTFAFKYRTHIILSHMDIQLFQHDLMERSPFPPLIPLPSLWKINWPYTCRAILENSILLIYISILSPTLLSLLPQLYISLKMREGKFPNFLFSYNYFGFSYIIFVSLRKLPSISNLLSFITWIK